MVIRSSHTVKGQIFSFMAFGDDVIKDLYVSLITEVLMLVGVAMVVDEDGQKGTGNVGTGPHSSQQLSSVSLDNSGWERGASMLIYA
jgi:hypothetical protein